MSGKYDNSRREEAAKQRRLRLALEQSRRGIRSREGRPRKERRAAERDKLLPADRVCPKCGKMKLRSKQWVVDAAAGVMCIGCFRTRFNEE
jgi:rubredoxin